MSSPDDDLERLPQPEPNGDTRPPVDDPGADDRSTTPSGPNGEQK